MPRPFSIEVNKMEAINEYTTGVVRVRHVIADANGLTGITAVNVYRKSAAEKEWTLVAVRNIITSDDVKFEMIDFSARAKTEYAYKVGLVIAGEEIEGASCNVRSDFGGVFIGTLTEQYVANAAAECTSQRQYNMTYVTPFYSKYPHAIQNGDANFSFGTARGWFNRIDEGCQITKESAEYNEALEDFLTNGEIKTLKKFDGRVWRVQIDNQIRNEETRLDGIVCLSFLWHEVEVPQPLTRFV